MTVIVEGRAMLVSVKWHKEEVINILNVYAPNVTETDGTKNKVFWNSITQFFTQNSHLKVDILMGDFNVVEDAQDRTPMRSDPHDATEALDNLKQLLQVNDAWRDTYSTKRAFSFIQDATSVMSRINRIYMTNQISVSARDWTISPSGIPGTDHHLTTVQIAHANFPKVGRRRWTLKSHIIKDEKFRNFVVQTGAKALEEIKALNGRRCQRVNPQTIYLKWKEEMLTMARDRDRIIVPRYRAEKSSLEEEKNRLLSRTDLDETEIRKELKKVEDNLTSLENKFHMAKRNAIAVKNRIDGETMCKYWTRSNKQARSRDLIYSLRKNNPGASESQYENNSVKMAELARNYHNNLQTISHDIPEEIREEKIRKVLGTVNVCTTKEQHKDLGKTIEYEEMIKALKKSNNSSAPGPDGIPYEFWKSMNSQFINDDKLNLGRGSQRSTCDLIELLRLMGEDIQWHGITDESSFSEGWMCPIYKKNEKTDISNYCPITCLNTDYKLFTKALTNRLAVVITDLIHPSKAGFIPGRSITEQMKLIRMMIHYTEAKEVNGLIVALDQEKAYDKIDHDYLWRTLERFGISDTFTNTVKSLYKTAETRIMINGILSAPWKIHRGVRQGDPLSCLLFDLAIEPLAASLRASNLKGYFIPGQAEKLIANLFADDTTTFLSADDNLKSLNEILDDWCIASKANFNSTKTEIIPVGTPEFQEEVQRERRTKPGGTRIPDSIHIVEDGTSIRILGAWFGNLIDLSAPWTNVLEKIDKSLANWEKSNPTLEGRRLIAQMVIAGMTQYLTQVQGMPVHIKKMITKRANTFMWGGKSPLVNEQTMFKPLDEGGRALVDIKTRNKAINVMWLKSYLKFGLDRPLWAYIADSLDGHEHPKIGRKLR